jgi:anaerobic ribonucleoside-triphosphate reductase
MPPGNKSVQRVMLKMIELKESERTRCEIWTRVMGYHRPVASFNKGKTQEHKDRKYFVEDKT